jgi:type VI secretion system protein ImpC
MAVSPPKLRALVIRCNSKRIDSTATSQSGKRRKPVCGTGGGLRPSAAAHCNARTRPEAYHAGNCGNRADTYISRLIFSPAPECPKSRRFFAIQHGGLVPQLIARGLLSCGNWHFGRAGVQLAFVNSILQIAEQSPAAWPVCVEVGGIYAQQNQRVISAANADRGTNAQRVVIISTVRDFRRYGMETRMAGTAVGPMRTVFDFTVQKKGGVAAEEIPFIVVVLANISGMKFRANRKVRAVDLRSDNLGQVLKAIRPIVRLQLPMPGRTEGTAAVPLELTFESLHDFEPANIAERLAKAPELVTDEPGGSAAALAPGVCSSGGSEHVLASALNTVLHTPAFQRLHATWLGITAVVESCARVAAARVAAIDITKEELSSDAQPAGVSQLLSSALDDMSLDTYGGHAPAVILGDFEFGPNDTSTVSALAAMAQARDTIFVGAASPEFFPGDSFCDVNDIDRTQKQHQGMSLFREWRTFRRQRRSAHVVLTLPPVLLRPPYTDVTVARGETLSFTYNEDVDPTTAAHYLWGSAVYALGRLLLTSFVRHGWVATLSPLDGPGLTLTYSMHVSHSVFPVRVGPTFVPIYEHSADVLRRMGFLPLIDCKETESVAAFEDHNCLNADDAAYEHVSHMVFILVLCRLRHSYALFRRSRDLTELPTPELEQATAQWISQYLRPPEADTQQLWPLEECHLRLSPDAHYRKITLDLVINYGGGRCGRQTFRVTVSGRRALRPSTGSSTDGSAAIDVNTDAKVKPATSIGT